MQEIAHRRRHLINRLVKKKQGDNFSGKLYENVHLRFNTVFRMWIRMLAFHIMNGQEITHDRGAGTSCWRQVLPNRHNRVHERGAK